MCVALVAPSKAQVSSVRVAFWNVESFFDPFADSTGSYNDYTEQGEQHWATTRFYRKRNNVYKALLALSENRPLGLLGLCEVENEYVLKALFAHTPLRSHNYRWVHREGPDRRGTEPALVYSLDHFMLVESAVFPYRNPAAPEYRSRDILYAKFIPRGSRNVADTLHVFVNHWPSRYSGELETVDARACAATILRAKIDSVLTTAPDGYEPKIIVMGDLNDTPSDSSVHDILRAYGPHEAESGTLVNLFAGSDLGFPGTLKHLAEWQVFDQIIVTESLLSDTAGLHYREGSASIFHPDFLLTDDETHRGKKPYRTYLGPRYLGGFSDHLPVCIDLE